MPNFTNQKYYLTTKHTKDTKVSDIDISKLLNFVLFVTFVVICLFLLWLRPCRTGSLVVIRQRCASAPYRFILTSQRSPGFASALATEARVRYQY